MNQSAAVLRVSAAKPKFVDWNGNEISTVIFKLPVTGKVQVSRYNLEGDEQADLSVHGGLDKAVYAYPIEQYEYWKGQNREFEWGSFGENLTTCGFTENTLCIGDQLKIGTAIFFVTQPRMPCFKLGIRLADPNMIKRFYRSGMWGFYLRVLQEGELETGDEIIHVSKDPQHVTLADVSRCFIDPALTADELKRVLDSKLAKQMKYQLQQKFDI